MHKDYDDYLKLVEESLTHAQEEFGPQINKLANQKLNVELFVARWGSSRQGIKMQFLDTRDLDEFIYALSPLNTEKTSWSWRKHMLFHMRFHFGSFLFRIFGKKLLYSFTIEDKGFGGMVYKNSKVGSVIIFTEDIDAALRAIRIIRNLIRTADMQTI